MYLRVIVLSAVVTGGCVRCVQGWRLLAPHLDSLLAQALFPALTLQEQVSPLGPQYRQRAEWQSRCVKRRMSFIIRLFGRILQSLRSDPVHCWE
jgi:hypothetical protein